MMAPRFPRTHAHGSRGHKLTRYGADLRRPESGRRMLRTMTSVWEEPSTVTSPIPGARPCVQHRTQSPCVSCPGEKAQG